MSVEIKETQILLTFKDDASAKFNKAMQDQIKYLQMLGVSFEQARMQQDIMLAGMGKSTNNLKALRDSTKAAAVEQMNLRNKMKDSVSAFAQLQYSISVLRNAMLLWFFVYRPIRDAISDVTKAAMEQEKAVTLLAHATIASKKISGEQRTALIAEADAIQRKTAIADEDIIAAQAVLVQQGLTYDKIQRAIPLVVDMTAAMRASGHENQTAADTARSLGSALQGRLTTLRTFGIHLSDNSLKGKQFSSIMNDIEKSVGGMGKGLTSDFSGRMNLLAMSFGELKESIGNLIIKSPVINSLLLIMSENIWKQKDSVDALNTSTGSLDSTWKGAIVTFQSAKAAIELLSIGLQSSWEIAKSYVQSYGEALGVTIEAVIQANKNTSAIQIIKDSGVGADIQKRTNETAAKLDALGKKAADVQSGKSDATSMKKLEDTMKSVASSTQYYEDLMKSIPKHVEEQIDTISIANERLRAIGSTLRNDIVDSGMKAIYQEGFSIYELFDNFGRSVMRNILEGMAEWVSQMMIIKGLGQITGGGSGGGSSGMFGGILKLGTSLLGLGGASAAMSAATNAGFGAISAGNLAGASGLLTAGSGIPMFHQGGYVSRKKYHSGGNADEVNATLQNGEYVVKRSAASRIGIENLNRINSTGNVGGVTNVTNNYIKANDVQSFRDYLMQNSDISVSATDKSIRNNQGIRRTMKEVM